MSEILKQEQTADRRDGRRDNPEDEVNPRLRMTLRHVDFVSPLGAFRARPDSELELAPKSSEVWADWRDDLGRRIAGTAMKTDKLLAERN